jgi:hypothetical protein
MVLEQTIDIPVDRRVVFEFLAPHELPAGPAHIELKVTPVDEEQHGTEVVITRNMTGYETAAIPCMSPAVFTASLCCLTLLLPSAVAAP